MPLSVLTQTDFTPRPATAAAGHFAKKAALTSAAFEKLSTEAKAHAFRIATVHKARLIQDVRNKVLASIEKGTDWAEVQRNILKAFDTEGVPKPTLPRLRTMFQMNTQQAYNDARRATLDEPSVSEAFPYRQYLTVGNGVAGINGVRPTHAALHGKIFAWDDPFWDWVHYPVGRGEVAYGCRCTFIALTPGQVKALGVRVIDLDYVRERIKVPGTNERGIAENPALVRGKFDLRSIDEELRKAVEAEIGQ